MPNKAQGNKIIGFMLRVIGARAVLIIFFAAAVYWLFESFICVFVFKEGSLKQVFFTESRHEIWLRAQTIIIIVLGYFLYKRMLKQQRSRKRAGVLFDKSQNGVLISDCKTKKVILANPAITKILGYSVEELIGLSILDIHPKDKANEIISQFDAQARGERGEMLEVPFLRKDKTLFYADVSTNVAIFDGIECSISMIRDVSDARQLREGLRRYQLDLEQEVVRRTDELKKTNLALEKVAEAGRLTKERAEAISERWAATFNSITDPLFIMDNDNNILTVNAAFYNMFRMSPGDVLYKKCYEVVHKTVKHWPGCPFLETKKDDQPHTSEIYDPVLDKFFLISTSPIISGNGQVKGVVHIAKDITYIKKSERKIQEAVNLKSEFISVVSHELRTPITTIKEGVAIVADGSAGKVNQEQQEFLDMALRNIDRLARLINDVLDFQKLEAGGAKFDIKQNDMGIIIKEVFNAWQELARRKGLKFDIEIEEGIPLVRFDGDKIMQAINNLVSNSIKYTDKGSVKLSCRVIGSELCVFMEDTGIGIKQDDIPKLFTKFHQLQAGKERKTGGTGLGLVISKQIIDGHGGRIEVESEVGKGSRFSFFIPLNSALGSA